MVDDDDECCVPFFLLLLMTAQEDDDDDDGDEIWVSFLLTMLIEHCWNETLSHSSTDETNRLIFEPTPPCQAIKQTAKNTKA